MAHWAYLCAACALAVAVLLATGWWRFAFAVFAIRPQAMTVDRLGLHVATDADVRRINTILGSFAGGFNAMIARPSSTAWRTYCASLPSLYQPFAHEGAAMGYTLRHLFRYDPAKFEARLVRKQPEFRYLYYVGLGFWSGMRNHDAARLTRIAADLDPLHRYLCYDGYGFKHAFFDYPKNAACLRRLDALEGYARNAAYQGVGRAFWFLYLSRPELLIERIGGLGEHASDAAAGAGLAAVFVNPDRLEIARDLGRQIPREWRPHYHLGICFGLKARSINNVEQFERDLASADPEARDAAGASIRECDRIELLVRAERLDDGYRVWRSRVTEWMTDHIEYPLSRVMATDRAAPRPAAGSLRAGAGAAGGSERRQ